MTKKNFNNPKNINPKKFKFKIYWVYAIIFIFFIGIQLINIEVTQPTNFKNFNDQMLQQGKVEKITVINMEQGIETLRSSISRNVLVDEVAKGSLNPEFLEFNDYGILSAKKFYDRNDMNSIEWVEGTTENEIRKENFIYSFLSSIRQKMQSKQR